MANLNDALQRNHPIWGSTTFAEVVDLNTAGPAGVPSVTYNLVVRGSYVTICNRTGQVLEIRTQDMTGAMNANGIAIANGDSFAFALNGRADIQLGVPVLPVAAQPIVLTWFPS